MLEGWDVVARGFYLEALLIDGDTIWYTDVVTGGVRRVGYDDVLLPERRMIGGLLLNEDGKLLVTGEGGIVWADPETGAEGVLVDGLPGVNEMRGDGSGGIYLGTIDLPAILRGARPGPSSIYHLDVSRRLTKVCSGLAFANGLSLSADGSRLIFNESFARTRCWQTRPDKSLGENLWSVDKYDCDGLAIDARGNAWITGFASDELICLDFDGREIERLKLPGRACTNIRFGRGDLRDLYVTMVEPDAVQMLANGAVPDEQSSLLLRRRVDFAGSEIATARFTLPA